MIKKLFNFNKNNTEKELKKIFKVMEETTKESDLNLSYEDEIKNIIKINKLFDLKVNDFKGHNSYSLLLTCIFTNAKLKNYKEINEVEYIKRVRNLIYTLKIDDRKIMIEFDKLTKDKKIINDDNYVSLRILPYLYDISPNENTKINEYSSIRSSSMNKKNYINQMYIHSNLSSAGLEYYVYFMDLEFSDMKGLLEYLQSKNELSGNDHSVKFLSNLKDNEVKQIFRKVRMVK